MILISQFSLDEKLQVIIEWGAEDVIVFGNFLPKLIYRDLERKYQFYSYANNFGLYVAMTDSI